MTTARCTWCSEASTGKAFANGAWRPSCGSCRHLMHEHAISHKQVDDRDAGNPKRRRRQGGRGRFDQR